MILLLLLFPLLQAAPQLLGSEDEKEELAGDGQEEHGRPQLSLVGREIQLNRQVYSHQFPHQQVVLDDGEDNEEEDHKQELPSLVGSEITVNRQVNSFLLVA